MDQADVDMLMSCETYEDAAAVYRLQFVRDLIAAMVVEQCKYLGLHEGTGDVCSHCGALRPPDVEVWSVEDKVRRGLDGVLGG